MRDSKIEVWDAAFVSGAYRRHHRQVAHDVESFFWGEHNRGAMVEVAAQRAGVGRSTAYRWIERRFHHLRDQGFSVADVRRQLRLEVRRTDAWEARRAQREHRRKKADQAALRAAVKESAHLVAAELNPAPTPAQLRKAVRDTRYWELRRQGESNTSASRILGMHRKTGTNIRLAARRSRALLAAKPPSGRYLSLAERLQIADLRHLGCSIRQVARELDRAPSTIKREIDRHTNAHGRYLPRSAHEAAAQNRRRPREYKLLADSALRRLVQRKLDLHWSPDEISGWLKVTFPDNPRMRVGHETIYRALLVRGGQGLDKAYCSKLRTGRTQRKSQWSRRPRVGGPVQNMTMIDQRPEAVETKTEIGHWEGDLVLGERCRSAMMTLRERKTQYGIIVNLPLDHTAETVKVALIKVFRSLPRHLRKTLTWDQGTEMAQHREVAAATRVDIYFAERSSPWQRGANENFNGLVRQYFPKGTDLSLHSEGRVRAVMRQLNTRPRKTLHYATPASLFSAERRSPLPTRQADPEASLMP